MRAGLDSCRITLGDLPLHLLSLNQTVEAVEQAVAARERLHVVTLNLDFVALARRDRDFAQVLREVDLVVCDGVPLLWLAGLLGHRATRVNGTDLVEALARRSALTGLRIALVGGRPEVGAAAAAELVRRWPGAQVTAIPTPLLRNHRDGADVARQVAEANADVLLVGLGAPLQERWAREHLTASGAHVAIGVGGSFDILAGVHRRAPLPLQRAGLEWAWRMLQDPRRLVARYLVRDLPAAAVLLRDVLRQRRSQQRQVDTRAPEPVAATVLQRDAS